MTDEAEINLTNNVDDQVSYKFLGLPGSYSHAAGHKMFPGGSGGGVPSFHGIVSSVLSGAAECGILPVENSVTGRIPDVHQILSEQTVFLVAEHILRVEHCLIASDRIDEHDVSPTHIFSHKQGFLQCHKFLQRVYPHAEQVVMQDTASAVSHVCKEQSAANLAIGSEFAAKLYGGRVVSQGVNDSDSNHTRFCAFVASRSRPVLSKTADVFAVIFAVSHEPGALSQALSILKDEHCDLLRIEMLSGFYTNGMPSFLIEFYNGERSEGAMRAITQLEACTSYMHFLGAFKGAVNRGAATGFLAPTYVEGA